MNNRGNLKMWRVLVGIVFIVIVGAAWYSAEETLTPPNQAKTQENDQTKKNDNTDKKPEEQLSSWGKGLALLVLAITLGFIVHQVYNEAGGDWKKVSLSPVNIALMAILILNVMAALGLPKWWLKFWDEHILFLLVNIGLVVAVHFFNKKSMAAKAVAVSIVLIATASAFNTYNPSSKSDSTAITKNLPAKSTLLGVVDVPTDKWSDEVRNPYLLRKVCWGRVDLAKGGSCQIRFDKDDKKIFPIKGGKHQGLNPETLEFKCTEAGARVKVESGS